MLSEKLSKDLKALLNSKENEIHTPLAIMTFRFSGQNGKAGELLHKATTLYFNHLGEQIPFWYFGYYDPTGSKSTFIRQPKDLRSKTIRDGFFSMLKKFKGQAYKDVSNTERDDRPNLNFSLKDGKKWRDAGGQRVEKAAAWMSFEPSFGGPQGTFSIGFPLADLEDETKRAAWLKLGDDLFAQLKATTGWLTPGLWAIARTLLNNSSHELTSQTEKKIYKKFPLVDTPIVHSGNHDIVILEDLKPHPYAGLLAPFWTTWLSSELAKKVKSFPGDSAKVAHGTRFMVQKEAPLDNDGKRYPLYKKAWAAFKAIQQKNEEKHPFFKRF